MVENELHEIKSSDTLQPSPAVLTDDVRQLHAIIARWRQNREQNNSLSENFHVIPV